MLPLQPLRVGLASSTRSRRTKQQWHKAVCLTDCDVGDPVSSGHIQRLQAATLGGKCGDSSISHASRASDIERSKAFLVREVFLTRANGGNDK